jgi:hypothetical protein
VVPARDRFQAVALKEFSGGFIQIADRIDRVIDPHP